MPLRCRCCADAGALMMAFAMFIHDAIADTRATTLLCFRQPLMIDTLLLPPYADVAADIRRYADT